MFYDIFQYVFNYSQQSHPTSQNFGFFFIITRDHLQKYKQMYVIKEVILPGEFYYGQIVIYFKYYYWHCSEISID